MDRLDNLIPQLRHPRPGLYTGGQPSPGAWPALARAGIRTVVNLRTAAELGARDEASEVRLAGLTYVNVPIDGAGTLGARPAAALWQALGQAKGDVLVHCGTGNRCGALLAHFPAEARLNPKEDVDTGHADYTFTCTHCFSYGSWSGKPETAKIGSSPTSGTRKKKSSSAAPLRTTAA